MTITPARIALDDPSAADCATVGSKAAHLAQLRAAGFTVPDGIVLPSALLAGWRAGTPAPAEVEHAVAEAVATFAGRALAVRSSADAEDAAGASFAGSYATVLGVTGVEQALAAVRTCLDSADAPRVSSYRGSGGIHMSVLVQPMLDPDGRWGCVHRRPGQRCGRRGAHLGHPRTRRPCRRRHREPRGVAGQGGCRRSPARRRRSRADPRPGSRRSPRSRRGPPSTSVALRTSSGHGAAGRSTSCRADRSPRCPYPPPPRWMAWAGRRTQPTTPSCSPPTAGHCSDPPSPLPGCRWPTTSGS